MRQVVPRGAVVGFLGVLALLAVLELVVGIGVIGWTVGLACGVGVNGLLAWGLAARGEPWLGPADRVTLTRAVLACGIAALTAYGFVRPAPVALYVAIAATALALDAVDGRVARRTGTSSSLGARFDMESDAFLILVLSIHVAPTAGWWVLAGGAARYALILATWCAPWLKRRLPARRWRKVVAGLQGVVLVVAASQVPAPAVTTVLLVSGLGLLALSFGTQVASLWRLRGSETGDVAAPARWVVASNPLAAARGEGVQCRT
jgi:phosphatidylglycerophosphate synthase